MTKKPQNSERRNARFPSAGPTTFFCWASKKADERSFYEIESANQNWTPRELRRQLQSDLYERLALSEQARFSESDLEAATVGIVLCKKKHEALVATACAGAGVTVRDRLLVEQELASGALVELLPAYRLPSGFEIDSACQ